MCFTIPLKVQIVNKDTALLEDGRIVRLGDLNVKVGDFLEVYADLAIRRVKNTEAQSARQLIKKNK